MFKNEEIRRMNIQRTAAIIDNFCGLLVNEGFSEVVIEGMWEVIDTNTNMIDALNLKKKMGRIGMLESKYDLFFSGELVESFREVNTLIATCNNNSDFKKLLEELSTPCCAINFRGYKEIVVLTNFWSSKVFEKYKKEILEFSIKGDVKIGFFLVTDYGTAKILRIS